MNEEDKQYLNSLKMSFESKMKDSQKKIVSSISGLGTTLWTAGFLFSLGLVPPPDSLIGANWYQQVIYLISRFIFWAVIVGDHFSK